MKNIKEYLKSEDKEIILYHKNGEIRIKYLEASNGHWWEYTYDDNGNRLTYKNVRGVERGFDIEEMTIEEICEALGKTIKITK